MRLLTCFLFTAFLLPAQTADEHAALAAAQRVFDAMAAHDATMLRQAVLPDARLYAIREDGTASSTAATDFATQIGGIKSVLVERFTGTPRVIVHGRIAQVWGEYVFLRDGKFGHCGVDSFDLLKTADGWKVAAIVYTSETTGCKGQ